MAYRKRIALLVAQADEYYQSQFVEGFIDNAFKHNADVLVFGSYLKYQNNLGREIGETSIFSLIPYEQFDAVAVMADTLQSSGLADSVEELLHQRCNCPVIFIDKESKYFPSVFPDHYDAVKLLVNHLIVDHKYTDIAFLTGKAWHHYSKQRLQAFMDAMSENSLSVGRNRVFYGDFWYTSGESLGERLIMKGDRLPQAIVCANDCMAIGLAKSLEAGGLSIPEDIAIASYDSTDEGRYSPKPITSIKIPAKSMGSYVVDRLFDSMEGKESEPFKDNGEFFHGRTCGCCESKVQYETKLRKQWDTDTSHNSVFSSFNHLDEDLVIQNSFDDLAKTAFSYIFQIRDFESFSICLNDKWQEKAKSLSGVIDESRLTAEKISNTDKFFTKKMMHVISCRPEELNCDRVSDNVYFDREVLVPRLDAEREKPEAFFFTSLHFEETVFGYAVISYSEPRAYNKAYRLWLHSAMRGLENFRRYDELLEINRKLEANLIRDPLTGIFNYNGFLRKVKRIIANRPAGTTENVGVLAIDVKNLSKINSDAGRKAGDKAIINAGKLLCEVFNEGYVFCMGNGEMVGIERAKDDADVDKVLEQKINELNAKIDEFNSSLEEGARKLELYYGLTVGTPKTQGDYEDLVGVALSRKNGQKASLQKLSADGLDEAQIKEARVVNEILDKNKINYHFQPIINAKNGEVFAYEALMRVDSELGLNPLQVLKYAGIFNRLYDIEKATFNNVLDYVNNNNDKFKPGAKVFVNSMLGQCLRNEDMAKVSMKAKTLSGRVVVEFTEQSEIGDIELDDIKREYQQVGFETAVDDYGTGYSNVNNLLRYMPNYVKIDRALLTGIQNSPQKQHFVKDIIEFSHDYNILALAEGIETSEELKTVIELGADLIQGYYTARPSGNIICEIPPEIKEEIIRYSANKSNGRKRRDYVAGREARISLPILLKDGYQTIQVTSGHVTYRDLHILGVPGDDPVMNLEIENGYKGKITLENCSFLGKSNEPAISIGDDCDVVISLSGDNQIKGRIKVSPKSTLTFEGLGNLSIVSTGHETYGIGNDLDSYHGDIVFNQDGLIRVSVNGTKTVAIGSGLGGHVTIRRGIYELNLTGDNSVGVGSFTGEVEPVIGNCYLEIKSRAHSVVGIGSIAGKADILLEHTSCMMNFDGDDVVMIGSKHSDKLQLCFYSGSINAIAKAQDITVLGSGTAEASNIVLDHIAMKVDLEGGRAGIYRGMDSKVKIRVSNSKVEGEVSTSLDIPKHAGDMDFQVSNSETKLSINGKPFEDFCKEKK